MLSGINALLVAKSAVESGEDILDAKDNLEDLEAFWHAAQSFDARIYRKYLFITALIIFGLVLAITLLVKSQTGADGSEGGLLILGYILFIPALAIAINLPKIFTLLFFLPMLARMFHAKMLIFWGIITLPWAVLTGYWIRLTCGAKVQSAIGGGAKRREFSDVDLTASDPLISVITLPGYGFYVPYYTIAFLAVFVFLGLYGRHDGWVWDEEHQLTRWARWGAGISAGVMSLLAYPLFFRRTDRIRLDDPVIVYDTSEKGLYHVISSVLQAMPIDIQAVLTGTLCVSLGLIWYAQAE